MKKMTYADLTPELLKDISAFTEASQMIEYCREKELEIDERDAEKLLEQIRKANELNREALSKVASGEKQYAGTRLLSDAAAGRKSECDYDCRDRDPWLCPEDEYQSCMSFHCWPYVPPVVS